MQSQRSSRDNPGPGNESRSLKRRYEYMPASGSSSREHRSAYASDTSIVSSFRGDNQRSGGPRFNERSHQRQWKGRNIPYYGANRSPTRAANSSLEPSQIDNERNISRSTNGEGPPNRQPRTDTAFGSRIMETSTAHKVTPSSPCERTAPVPDPDKTAHRKVKRLKMSENGHQVVESEVSPTPDEPEPRKQWKSHFTRTDGGSSPAG